MRENRTCGSEGGEAQSLPYPYPGHAPRAPSSDKPSWSGRKLLKLCPQLARSLKQDNAGKW